MSGDVPLFFERILGYNGQTLVYPLIQTELPRIVSRQQDGLRSQASNRCLLADMGDFLINILDITSELAEKLVLGRHIRDYANDNKASLAQEDDLHSTDYLFQKEKALK